MTETKTQCFKPFRNAGLARVYLLAAADEANDNGPILMAVMGGQQEAVLAMHPEQLIAKLRPKAGSPLHFTIAGNDRYEFLPYWQVQNEVFTCFPIIGPTEVINNVADSLK